MAFTKVCEDEYSIQARPATLAKPVFRFIPFSFEILSGFTFPSSFILRHILRRD